MSWESCSTHYSMQEKWGFSNMYALLLCDHWGLIYRKSCCTLENSKWAERVVVRTIERTKRWAFQICIHFYCAVIGVSFTELTLFTRFRVSAYYCQKKLQCLYKHLKACILFFFTPPPTPHPYACESCHTRKHKGAPLQQVRTRKKQGESVRICTITGVACIRDVGCPHSGFDPFLARIRCPKVRCVHPSKLSFWLRASVPKTTLACIRFRNDPCVHPFSKSLKSDIWTRTSETLVFNTGVL